MKTENMKKKIISMLMGVVLLTGIFPVYTAAQKIYSRDEIMSYAERIISWKKLDNSSTCDGNLLNVNYLALAGTTAGDWYPIGLSRLGKSDDYAGYLSVLKAEVERRYAEPGMLSAVKATEWHRISLAVLAAGGDPEAFGVTSDGRAINLIADGTYNRALSAPLGRQGINGLIWGLITLDAGNYDIPDGACDTRESIISAILGQILPDGGFALSGEKSDPDITAMALQALTPYYDTDSAVKSAVESSIAVLSSLQLESGGYESWGTENSESISQVIIALCGLGIDPQTDERFIKNGNTLLDALLSFRMSDGGFLHSYIFDEDNPSSKPDESNSMAGEQALLAFASVVRLADNMGRLYDFSDITERTVSGEFTSADALTVKNLAENINTSAYPEVIRLLAVAENDTGAENREEIIAALKKAKEDIESLKKEIEALNSEIADKLYPFENISLKDKKTVDDVIVRYNALPQADKAQIIRYEDVIKTKTKIDNEERTIVIFCVISVIITFIAAAVIISVRKKLHRKRDEMEALAGEYGDDE